MIANNACGAHSVAFGTTADNVHGLDVTLADGTRMSLGSVTPVSVTPGAITPDADADRRMADSPRAPVLRVRSTGPSNVWWRATS
jgi:hypothetical protein